MDTTEQIYEVEASDSLVLNRLDYAIRLRISEFSGAEFKVWMCHLSHANNKSGRSFAGVRMLIRETGLSEHAIKLAHAGLVRKGWLKRYRVVNSKNGQRTTSTTFCKWPPPIPGSMWERAERMRRNGNGKP